MNFDRFYFQKALEKYGEQYRAVFGILPDDDIHYYLDCDYFDGLKKLHEKFGTILNSTIQRSNNDIK